MYSLLYVDDEPGLLEITKLFLERKGNFSVDTSLSATDALLLPGIASYDAIVSDYQMPGMDGIAFLKAVREKFKDIPFILFTGRGREEVVIEAINNGADFYLQKGGDPSAQFAELAHKARQAIARRNAERSLVESEKRLADIINFLPDATFAIDRSGRVIAWNRAIEGMTGVPAGRMMGKGNYEYAVPFYGKRRPILIDLIFEPDEKIAGFYSGIIREGPTLTAETDLPHPKGIRINVLAKASPLYNREGAVVGAIESIRDITGLKHAEKDLFRARKDWETIFRAIGHPAFVLDAENRIIDANDATIAATKKTLSELIGLHCYEVFHTPGTAQPPPGCPFEQANAPGALNNGETEIAALDGYYAVTCTPVYGADGKLEKVIHIAMDVTARRKATDELRAAYEQMTATEEQLRANFEELAAHEKRLSENETKFRAVFEKSHDALVLFTKDGCIDCNRHAVELFGYGSREELIGVTVGDTSAPVQPDGRPSATAAAEHMRTAMEQGADRFEWLQLRKDGTTFPAEILLSGYVLDGKEVYLSSIRDITSRKRAEGEIHALSTELQQIFKNMTNAFIVFESVFNEKGGYVSFRFGRFNDAYARIAKVTYEEVKGKDIFEVWPGTEQSWVETFGKVATTGVSAVFEMYHGPTRGWYRCNAYRPTDSPDKVCVIFEDITERKKTEEALLQANIVVENSPAVLFRWKAEEGWPVVYVSQNVSRFGYTPEELVRGVVPYATLVYPDDLNRVAGEVEQFTRQGTNRFRQQYRIVTRAGEVRWVDDYTVIERGNNGKATHYQGILMDITDRKRSEAALRESEEKYRHILTNMQDAYIQVDENGTITMVSPSAVRMYGYGSVEEMTGIPVESLYVRYGQQREELIRQLRENRGVTDFTGEAVRKDGSVFWVSVSAQFLRDETGRIVGTEGVARDISERKAMEHALQDANRKLTLLNTITRHDLANKAAVITGLASAAQLRKPGPDTGIADILKKIEAAGADIAAQIAFTKSYQELGVHAPVWQDVREIAARQEAGGIAVTCTCDAGIFADPMFEKVMDNFIDNAARHGERVTQITVSCEPGPEGLVVAVADNGVGVPDELKEKIFERGFGKHTGFGLFLAREILAITGITIRETGVPGKGARFEMVVPEGGYRGV